MNQKTSGRAYGIFHVMKATEGGMGQKSAMLLLKQAGIECKPTTSIYVGHTAVIVYGGARVMKRAEKILFGR